MEKLEGISVIIPTINEAQNIEKLIHFIEKNKSECNIEIIVCDGGSQDDTVVICKKLGVKVIESTIARRSIQLHMGAMNAIFPILFFVHADTIPPATFAKDIQKALESGFGSGRYRSKFDSKSLLFSINAFFTRFDWFVCYGGDQSLFVTKEIYDCVGGFDPNLLIMEEYDLTHKIKGICSYKVMRQKMLISTRKYQGRGWLNVLITHFKIIQMYKEGIDQSEIMNTYNKRMHV
jgi:rSAM/selenodomain-associated transferase 2